ncbi:phosphatase PAP2/dual specificity phosphatase family protein [Pseudomonas sp. S60]|uniref:phosphatase PAP2/dual specificity phosphatase family protein n=1 Tax=Pseudomonas sp. S60 TaxID=211124 RepID=UPI0019130321|nr:phosphatase PAP2/dual specificity phosphatase family protein [Pseudomonas sp. S60]MBK5011784.1 phosphatase PAP2/dual specificity phosphatase family protein [Pseudomonas sp. S60]
MNPTREVGLIRRGVCWLLLLGPLFFLSYGLANNYAAGRSDVGSLVFGWETRMPLWPWTIIPYWSIDLLYGLSFLLPRTRQEMDRHALALLSAQLICVACFILWPLRFTFERPALDGLFGWLFDLLMGFDKPFNQAPSLHIALLVIIWTMFARHVHRQPWRWLVHGWMGLIGLSVLTTWQHHFIDLPTGALAGLVCLWLWPETGRLPWQGAQLARDTKRWRIASYYLAGALVCTLAAATLRGAWLWLLWPCVSLLLVALNYAVLGACGFQKNADGHLSVAATWLLGPYLLGAWLNARVWTWRHPQPNEVCDGVYLGRIPARTLPFAAVVDLCAELPFLAKPSPTATGAPEYYEHFPALDLIPPPAQLLRQAAARIEQLHSQGPLLVCCALGYSRSACAVAAWLIVSGRCADAQQAEALVRKARPGIRLHAAHQRVLQHLRRPL